MSAGTVAARDDRTMEMAWLKTRLLAEGLRLALAPEDVAAAKPMHRVRSGSCGGLDLVLPDGTWVNAPVLERFARSSTLELRSAPGGPVLVDGDREVPVSTIPVPAYYGERSSRGTELRRLAQLCSDRVGVGLTNVCTYYRSTADRCRFCSIGLNTRTELGSKDDDEVIEALLAAVTDRAVPARHVLLGGGTPNSEDAGAPRMAAMARRLREHTDVPIYAMLAPPRDLRHLEGLAEAGVDEVGLNIEVFGEAAARRYIPGKDAAVSRRRHLDALDRCVELFGPINTRSIVVVGLESFADTVAGVERLAERGVMPILSPLRPLDGTPLEGHARTPAAELWELTLAAAEAAGRHGIPLGPTCIPCQSNVLSVPGHPAHRWY